ncbi:MAG TPA: efflux RND transporter periplasmic adaptor subunit [Planctomycetaceae bacterium]|nr:efflux RND transporter periplasmic adaptor subunit [Planctomycetaceae bacterium]
MAAVALALVSLSLSGCEWNAHSQEQLSEDSHAESHGESGHATHKIVVTSPVRKDVVGTQPYVCQIHSCKHIEVRALEGGYLQEIGVKEGQVVKKGDLMFQILPTLYEARLDSEVAEANRTQIELNNAQTLSEKGIVSPQEIALKTAELAKAQAKVKLATAELGFTSIRAPFDGIVDRQRNQLGSLIDEGDVLTTFSDNSVMWVYFNVPEARYLEYKAELDSDDAGRDDEDRDDENNGANQLQIELKLANGQTFHHHGKIGAIEADFNNTTGNIAFRADFPNPDGLLRHGQTGTVLIHRVLKNALVIPQRATFEILAKRYAYVVDADNVVHQRDITILSEQDDIYVIQQGLDENDKIILEGIREVRDGDKKEYEFRPAEDVLGQLKYHAE